MSVGFNCFKNIFKGGIFFKIKKKIFSACCDTQEHDFIMRNNKVHISKFKETILRKPSLGNIRF